MIDFLITHIGEISPHNYTTSLGIYLTSITPKHWEQYPTFHITPAYGCAGQWSAVFYFLFDNLEVNGDENCWELFASNRIKKTMKNWIILDTLPISNKLTITVSDWPRNVCTSWWFVIDLHSSEARTKRTRARDPFSSFSSLVPQLDRTNLAYTIRFYRSLCSGGKTSSLARHSACAQAQTKACAGTANKPPAAHSGDGGATCSAEAGRQMSLATRLWRRRLRRRCRPAGERPVAGRRSLQHRHTHRHTGARRLSSPAHQIGS